MRVALVLAAVLLTACNPVPVATSIPDQCVRQQLFQACMKALPAGPVATHYNDWSEVVEACESSAYYQSFRLTSTIKPECRAR